MYEASRSRCPKNGAFLEIENDILVTQQTNKDQTTMLKIFTIEYWHTHRSKYTS